MALSSEMPRVELVGKGGSRPRGPRSIHLRATRWQLGGGTQSALRCLLWLRRRWFDDALVGREFGGLGDIGDGMGVVTFARVSATSARIGGRIVWIELDSLVVVRDRAVNFALKTVGIAPVVIGQHVVRVALDHR